MAGVFWGTRKAEVDGNVVELLAGEIRGECYGTPWVRYSCIRPCYNRF